MFTCLAYWYFKGRKLNLHCVRYRTCIPCRLRIQLGSTLDQAVHFVDMNYSRMLHFQRTFTKYINVTFCWQFCVHSDKKKMLEELTNDIHQSPNKQKVLMELANCIASGEDILPDFCDYMCLLTLLSLTPGFFFRSNITFDLL